MSRQFFLDLAARGHRMPIGTDLILHQQPDPERILLDGDRLGRVVAQAAADFRTPVGLLISSESKAATVTSAMTSASCLASSLIKIFCVFKAISFHGAVWPTFEFNGLPGLPHPGNGVVFVRAIAPAANA